MTPNETVAFIKALKRKANSMGWSKGTKKQITKFTNRDGVDINIIKNYDQIDMATLKTACERFCKAGESVLQAMVLAGLISQLKWRDSLKACHRSKQRHKLVT